MPRKKDEKKIASKVRYVLARTSLASMDEAYRNDPTTVAIFIAQQFYSHLMVDGRFPTEAAVRLPSATEVAKVLERNSAKARKASPPAPDGATPWYATMDN